MSVRVIRASIREDVEKESMDLITVNVNLVIQDSTVKLVGTIAVLIILSCSTFTDMLSLCIILAEKRIVSKVFAEFDYFSAIFYFISF